MDSFIKLTVAQLESSIQTIIKEIEDNTEFLIERIDINRIDVSTMCEKRSAVEVKVKVGVKND